jgi:hypothetical protein
MDGLYWKLCWKFYHKLFLSRSELQIWRESAYGRRLPLTSACSVSALEKFPGYSGINSEISDLAVVISNKFAKADTQNLIARGG